MTDNLIVQYAAYAYPQPIRDLKQYVKNGGRDYSDPALLRRKYWPRDVEPRKLNILVAGCGSNQAAIIAYGNPTCRVVGIDLSEQALHNHALLKKANRLDALELHHLAIEQVASLNEKFDLIICTGVLHHLRSPEAGLRALTGVLAPDGVMSLMLYGLNQRSGVYQIQEALTAMGAGPNPKGLSMAKSVLKSLPEWHHAQHYIKCAPDLKYDAGIVDTFLNARDRAYSVPDLFALVDQAGLKFQSWLDGLHYSPLAVFPEEAEFQDDLQALPLISQWHVTDLLGQICGTHRFVVCHPQRSPADYEAQFADEAWLSFIPTRHPDLRFAGDGGMSREWQTVQMHNEVLSVLERMDGKATFRQLLGEGGHVLVEEMRDVFGQLYEWDHFFVQLPAA